MPDTNTADIAEIADDVGADYKIVDWQSPAQITDIVEYCRGLDYPVGTFGPPGLGKSEGFRAAMREGDQFIDVRLALKGPTDIAGYDVPVDPMKRLETKVNILETKARHYERRQQAAEAKGQEAEAEDFAVKKHEAELAVEDLFERFSVAESAGMGLESTRPGMWPTEGQGIALLEEVNTASRAVGNTALQLLGSAPNEARQIGRHQMPEGFYFGATGNRKVDAANVNPVTAPLLDRMAVYIFDEPDVKAWTAWAARNGVHPWVTGFINFKSEMLYRSPMKVGDEELYRFPTPRSWTRGISRMLHRKTTIDRAFVRAVVGEAASTEFMTFTEHMDELPNINALMEGADPERDLSKMSSHAQHAVTTTLASKVFNQPDASDDEKEQVVIRAAEIASELSSEITGVFATMILEGNDIYAKLALQTSGVLTEWNENNQKYTNFDPTD